MALNDWADREVDAVERPERLDPVRTDDRRHRPRGRRDPRRGGPGRHGGLRRPARRCGSACPLALLVATYDLRAKDSPAGPLVMASTRGLDVLLGAAAAPGAALAPAAAARGAHRRRHPAQPRRGARHRHGRPSYAALGGHRHRGRAPRRVDAARRRGRPPAPVGGASPSPRRTSRAWAAPRPARWPTPDGPTVRVATGAGIGGLTLLQASWLAARGRLRCRRRGGRRRPAAAPRRTDGEPDMSIRLGYGLNGFAGHRLADACAVVSSLGYEGVGPDPRPAPPRPVRRPAAPGRRTRGGAWRPTAWPRSWRPGRATCSTRGTSTSRPWSATSGRERRVDLLRRAVRIAHELGSEAVSCWSGTAPVDASPARAVAPGRRRPRPGARRRGRPRRHGLRRARARDVPGHPRRRPRLCGRASATPSTCGSPSTWATWSATSRARRPRPYAAPARCSATCRSTTWSATSTSTSSSAPASSTSTTSSAPCSRRVTPGLACVELPRHSHAAPVVAKSTMAALRASLDRIGSPVRGERRCSMTTVRPLVDPAELRAALTPEATSGRSTRC